ncbi:MAG: hypothetical protein ACKVJU_23175 [Verrucomicrobiales bacterium]
MKKLIVVANDIESSGKSTVSRAIASHLTNLEINCALISSDERELDRGFKGEFWDFQDDMEVSQLIFNLDRYDVVVLDVQSGMARVWAEFCEENEIDDLLNEMDVEMTMVIPCNESERSNEEVVDLAEIFSDQTDYVIAHLPLEVLGSREVAWKGSGAAKAVKYLGAYEANMPEIGAALKTALNSADMDLVKAFDNLKEVPRFLEVQAMQWLDEAGAALAESEEYIVPEEIGGLVASY